MELRKIALGLLMGALIALSITLGIHGIVQADINPGTNIDTINAFAWNDLNGWWDFHITHTTTVGSNLHGYATSSIGEMALNCESTPSGDICSTSNFRVTNPNASGLLSGCAWNDTNGWISFWCGDADCDGDNVPGDGDDICINSEYRVSIDADGIFHGFAWNDVSGWISFNCAGHSGCATSDYKVQTDWLPGRIAGYLESTTIDTAVGGGTVLNSMIWQGEQPSGSSADFQIAVSNCANGATNFPTCDTGTWTFKGPGGSASEYYGSECPTVGSVEPAAGPDRAICVERSQVANFRYLKYKVRLQSDLSQSITPRVDDIILNWSN